MKKVLFVDTVHPYLWEELQKEGYSCIEGYDLSEKAIIEQHNDAYGLVIRSRISINANFLSHFNKLTFIACRAIALLKKILDYPLEEKKISLSDYVITNDNSSLVMPQILSVHSALK